MAKLRTVEGIYRGPAKHWVGDGFWVRNYVPSLQHLVAKVSPFFLLDYHEPHRYPPTANTRRGVGPHPHRGLETVTIVFEGSVAHHDSAGNGGVIDAGDVQWMTAGSGLLHREYHEAGFARAGGMFHLLQLWVNLPRAQKMTPPKYQSLPSSSIKEVPVSGGRGVVRVIAGTYSGIQGPAQTFTPIELYDVKLNAGGKASFSLPKSHNVALLIYSGKARLDGDKMVDASDLVVYSQDGDDFSIEAVAGSLGALVMSGEPIDEPIAAGGPFLMNDPAEIQQAFADYQAGKFGALED